MNTACKIAIVCGLVAMVVCTPFPDPVQRDREFGEGPVFRIGGPSGPLGPLADYATMNLIGRNRQFVDATYNDEDDSFSCQFTPKDSSITISMHSSEHMPKRRLIAGACIMCDLCSAEGMQCSEIALAHCL